VLPKSTEAVGGVIVTLMEEGVGVGGGGWTTEELVTALPQPRADALAMRRPKISVTRKRGFGGM